MLFPTLFLFLVFTCRFSLSSCAFSAASASLCRPLFTRCCFQSLHCPVCNPLCHEKPPSSVHNVTNSLSCLAFYHFGQNRFKTTPTAVSNAGESRWNRRRLSLRLLTHEFWCLRNILQHSVLSHVALYETVFYRAKNAKLSSKTVFFALQHWLFWLVR